MIKNPPANAGDSGDVGSIPGSGRSLGGGNSNYSSISAGNTVPWTEEPGRLHKVGHGTVTQNIR